MGEQTTGDRVPRKARRIAAELGELGRIRHVEGNPPSPMAWVVTLGIVVVFTVVISLGTGGVSGAVVLLPVWAVLGLVILGYLGAEKVVVLDHGLFVGSFAVFLRPRVVPFDRLEAASITAVRPGWKLATMLREHTRLTTGRTAVWAWNGVAFVAAPGPVARRRSVDAAGTFGPEAPERRERIVWWFGTWRRPDRLVRALQEALAADGKPVGGLSENRATLVRISGDPGDASRQVPRLVTALDGFDPR